MRNPHPRRKAAISSRRAAKLSCQQLEKRLLLIAEGAVFELPQQIVDSAGLLGDVSAEIHWGDGEQAPVQLTGGNERGDIKITFDYSLDTNRFFGNNDDDERRQLLEIAADSIVSRFGDDLAAVTLTDNDKVQIYHPSSGEANSPIGSLTEVSYQSLAANQIVIFPGARSLPANFRGLGAGYSTVSGAPTFVDSIVGRGEPGALLATPTDFAPSFGSITFDNADTPWYFGADASGFEVGQIDFITIATHELAHALGFGVAKSWDALVGTDGFTGQAANAAYTGSGNVPIFPQHWAQSVRERQPTIMTPDLSSALATAGQRELFSPLDFAGMDDIGWEVLDTSVSVPSLQHTYSNNGDFTPVLVLKGAQSGELTLSLDTVNVTNVAPTLQVPDRGLATVGQPLTITDIGVITDPGTESGFTFKIDWGDGTTVDAGTATIDSTTGPTSASFDGTHTYQTAGVKTVTVTAADGDDEVSNQFQLTVEAVDSNTPPTISNIGNQTTIVGMPTSAIAFSVGDAETAAGDLTVTATTDDATLLPSSGLVLGGDGADRTITITPAAGQTGTATITVTVGDGDGDVTTSDSFDLTVNPTPSDGPLVTISPSGPGGDPEPLPGTNSQPTSWAIQRSSLRQISVDLPITPATVSASDLVLTNLGIDARGGGDPDQIIDTLRDDQLVLAGNQLTINLDAGQLSDGVYQLELKSALTGGDAFTIVGSKDNGLFVLTGDWNGSGAVTVLDFATFSYWFSRAVKTNPNLPEAERLAPEYVDLNPSGFVSVLDYAPFSNNFSKSLRFPGDPAGVTATVSFSADVDGDGAVTNLDAVRVIHALEVPSGDGEIALPEDVNSDGRVTAADALFVINRLAEDVSHQRTLIADDQNDVTDVIDGLLTDGLFVQRLF